jgi:hypothetical protein
VVVGAAAPCPIASITMSASSSDVDPGGGGAGVVGWALAVPPASPETPISTRTADTSNRIVTHSLQIVYA